MQIFSRGVIVRKVRRDHGCPPRMSTISVSLSVDDGLDHETTNEGRNNGSQWSPWVQLDDLDFADDLTLLSHN